VSWDAELVAIVRVLCKRPSIMKSGVKALAHDDKHGRALIFAVVYMAAGILLAAGFSRFGIDLGVTFAIIMLAPVLLYLIASGSISEFSGVGFSAKLRDIATAPAKFAATIEPLELVGNQDKQALITMARDLTPTPGKPVALTFLLNDPTVVYVVDTLKDYMDTLRKIDPDLSVVFTNPNGTFAASSDGARVHAVLENDSYGYEFVGAVQAGDIAKLRKIVSATPRHVSESTSNAEALRIMNEDGLKSLISVDAQQRPAGVIRRDRIIAELVAGVASGA
jgi:hypothetical protein